MPVKRLRDESGYSLLELMVSIMLLTIAILPMVGMFDIGLNHARTGGNYDKARALANLKMEEAKNIPFADVENDFPEEGNTTPYDSALLTEDNFPNFKYRVEKQYMLPPTDSDVVWQEAPGGTPTHLIRVTVTVQWADGNEYTTFGLVTA